MRVWRIAVRKWALERTGQGASQEGGRWNPAGLPALYAACTVELCALEKLVHLGRAVRHPAMSLVAIDLPDDPRLRHEPALDALPPFWNSLTSFDATQEYGGAWLAAGTHLFMMVPSVVIPEATNIVINPRHAGMAGVAMEVVREFSFDGRLL